VRRKMEKMNEKEVGSTGAMSPGPDEKASAIIQLAGEWRYLAGYAKHAGVAELPLRELEENASIWVNGGMNERYQLGFACEVVSKLLEQFNRRAWQLLKQVLPGDVEVITSATHKAFSISLYGRGTYNIRNTLKQLGFRWSGSSWDMVTS